MGSRAKLEAGSAFTAGTAVGKRLATRGGGRVAVMIPEANDYAGCAQALVEGLIVGSRGPDLRKSEPGRKPIDEWVLVTSEANRADLERAMTRGEVVGQSINLARDLANTPPSEKAPAALADRIRAILTEAGVAVDVWDRGKIAEERFGGLLGVAAGSDEPPAFVKLSWRKGGDQKPLALVGKGVTFDSGGLSLKPSASMEDMKSDMTGAAVVAATILAAAKLDLPVNVDGYLAFTENMTGGRAMKLGDVLTARNGKTIEVLNTDAEGRLILADALSFAVESQPAGIIDLATLTGACLVALGTKFAGLFSNNDVLAEAVAKASKSTGERVWRMPMDEDYLEALKSNVADLKNIGGKWGGAITAAKFLEQFVGEVPWVHLDIAGPSWADTDSPSRDAGGTGCFVRTLVRLLEQVNA